MGNLLYGIKLKVIGVHRRDAEYPEEDDFPFAIERTANGNRSAASLRRFRCLLSWQVDRAI